MQASIIQCHFSIQFCCKEVIWRSTVHRCPLFPNACVHDALCGLTHLSPADWGVRTLEKPFQQSTCKGNIFPHSTLENLQDDKSCPNTATVGINPDQVANKTDLIIQKLPTGQDCLGDVTVDVEVDVIRYERCRSNCCNSFGSKQCILDILNHSYCVIQSRTNTSLLGCHCKEHVFRH